ncbi:MAG: class I SAM-dependent methyltransferase [Syntrophales bacterium]|nr:class I SAM-dependent methyltransferase [Syntrophales bacterium]
MKKVHFYEITGQEYIDEMRKRLHGELNLVWIKQCRRIVEPIIGRRATILDVGCGVGYLYKYFKDLEPVYFGIDGENRLLEIGREYYASDADVHFLEHDISESPIPPDFCPKADLVVCSATVEHLPSAFPALDYMVASASKVLYLRTFLGETSQLYSIESPVSEFADQYRKHVNQYAFDDIFRHLGEQGFRVKAYRDEYTDSMPYLIDGAVRTFYVTLAVRP